MDPTGVVGLFVGIAGILVTLYQTFRLHRIRTRNRAHTWRLATNCHQIMAWLEQIEEALRRDEIRLDGRDALQMRAFISSAYTQSASIVSTLAEHLVLDYNVTQKELQRAVEGRIAWGHLQDSIQRAIAAIEPSD